jgi:site-specific recombinase XerD
VAEPGSPSFDRLLVSWERSLRARNLSKSTLTVYLASARALVSWLLVESDAQAWDGVTKAHLETWIAHLIESTSASTANNRYRSVQQLFKWLLDDEEIDTNPMARMSPPKLEEKLVPILSATQIKQLLKACTGNEFVNRRDAAIIRLFLATGIRLAEMAGLAMTDINYEDRTAVVTGKGRRTRIVRFDAETARLLDRYERVRAANGQAGRPELWLGEKARGPLTTNGIYQMVKRRAAQVGIELHPHMFRHTFAHRFQANDGAEGDLMELAGWRSQQMVRRYGATARGERARTSYDRVGMMDDV